MCRPCWIIIQSCDFYYRISKPFTCSCFVFYSLEVTILRAQRIIAFFIFITHKSTRSEDPITWLKGLPHQNEVKSLWLLSIAPYRGLEVLHSPREHGCQSTVLWWQLHVTLLTKLVNLHSQTQHLPEEEGFLDASARPICLFCCSLGKKVDLHLDVKLWFTFHIIIR